MAPTGADDQHRHASLGRLLREAERLEHHVLPAWRRRTRAESRLPVLAAILVAVALQLALPDKYGLRPRAVIPALELALLVLLTALNPMRLDRHTIVGRYASYALVAAVTVDNTFSAGLLDHAILDGHAGKDATGLLASGAGIYLTNVIAFGIWYWEFDRGGPFERSLGSRAHTDFLFPQMANPELAAPDWEPRFLDYLYVSFTNAAAFSPTDTMPLSRWSKTLMALQSMVALSTSLLVVARAVNILS